jgi:MerR family transcriptional regulator, activator of bmr gene
METRYFLIGKIAKIKGVTVKALRFYDRIGLLKPCRVDPESRYRYYCADQFLLIDIIKAARMMDISPNELIPYFRNKDTQGLLRLIGGQRERTLSKIRRLETAATGMEQIIANFDKPLSAEETLDVFQTRIPDRHGIALPYEVKKTVAENVQAYARLDIHASKLGLFNTYGTGLLFERNGAMEFHPAYLFTTISQSADDPCYRLIPGGEYLCVRYTADTAARQQKKLQQQLLKLGLDVLGVVQIDLTADLFGEAPNCFELEIRIGD